MAAARKSLWPNPGGSPTAYHPLTVRPSWHDAQYCSKRCYGLSRRQPWPDSFWANVACIDDATSCWLWTGLLSSQGYGMVRRNNRSYAAHRIAWELTHGPIPAGLFVCHTCDTPACVRWDGEQCHLFLGTHLENMADMRQKGRAAMGEKNGSNTTPEVHLKRFPLVVYSEIQALSATGQFTYKQLGEHYGVGATTIYYIVKKQKHIP